MPIQDHAFNVKLFVDDIRVPASDDWIVLRSYDEAIEWIKVHGLSCISTLSLDHDLGDNVKSGYDIAKTLIDMELDGLHGRFMPSFNYIIHSMNPVGRLNIRGLFNAYFNHNNTEYEIDRGTELVFYR